jgi:nitrate/nitrite transporter NarK
MKRTPWTTGTAGVIAALGMLGFALFPLAIPFVLLTAVFTAPLLLIGVAAAVPLGVVAALVMAIRATARRIERRDSDSHQKLVRARPRGQHGLPPASARSG